MQSVAKKSNGSNATKGSKAARATNDTTPPNYEISLLYVINNMKKFISQGVQRDFVKELEFLYNLISPVNVRMRVEIIDDSVVPRPHIETKSRILEEPNFAHFAGVTGGRIILTQNRNKSNFNFPLAFEANGVVLDSTNYDVISMPSIAFNPKTNRREIIENFNSYAIYPMYDGTTVNLYYYKDAWILSSTNGYEVDNFKWMGSHTYREAFDKVLKSYPDFDLSKLNRDCSYTIGFRFADFHPFVADSERAWLIQAINCKTLESDPTDIGLAMQVPITFDVAAADSYDNMVNANAKSIDTYMAAFTDNSKRTPDNNTILEMAKKIADENPSSLDKSVHYGYILRSPVMPGKYCSNVILESELFKKIRLFIYNLPKGPMLQELEARGVKLDQSTRMHFLILRNYLDRTNRDLFMRLFPNLNGEVLRYESMFNSVANRILQYFKNRKTKNVPPTSDDPAAIIVDKIANCLSVSIARTEQINPHDINAREIIYDLIVNNKYIDLYYNVLY